MIEDVTVYCINKNNQRAKTKGLLGTDTLSALTCNTS
jgi:hypothetical protein